jgi:hypothetical protein
MQLSVYALILSVKAIGVIFCVMGRGGSTGTQVKFSLSLTWRLQKTRLSKKIDPTRLSHGKRLC